MNKKEVMILITTAFKYIKEFLSFPSNTAKREYLLTE